MRRELGPVAWSALELLAMRAERTSAGALVVTLGVRELAQQLGVGRDAAARAMGMLREHGLISFAQNRAGAGRFDGTHHTVHIERVLEATTRPTREAQDTPRRDQAATLFDLDDAAPSANQQPSQ
jgi:DNA-binding transcriptional MocR family regulator